MQQKIVADHTAFHQKIDALKKIIVDVFRNTATLHRAQKITVGNGIFADIVFPASFHGCNGLHLPHLHRDTSNRILIMDFPIPGRNAGISQQMQTIRATEGIIRNQRVLIHGLLMQHILIVTIPLLQCAHRQRHGQQHRSSGKHRQKESTPPHLPPSFNRSDTVVPFPSALVNSSAVPCTCATAAHRARPSPAPFCARARDLSTM